MRESARVYLFMAIGSLVLVLICIVCAVTVETWSMFGMRFGVVHWRMGFESWPVAVSGPNGFPSGPWYRSSFVEKSSSLGTVGVGESHGVRWGYLHIGYLGAVSALLWIVWFAKKLRSS